MDTLPGSKDNQKPLPLNEDWEAALAAEDPAALLFLISQCPPPKTLGLAPWPVRLARKVSIVQWWGSSNWTSPYYDGWMEVWRTQPKIPPQHWPEILQEALLAMGKSEIRFKASTMYHGLWNSFVDQMIQSGMDINAPLPFQRSHCLALDFLLKSATVKPYPIVALYWIQHYGARFSTQSTEGAIHIIERLHDLNMSPGVVDAICRHLILFLDDYGVASQLKINACLTSVIQDSASLISYSETIFLGKQTQQASGSAAKRRL